VDVKIIWHIVDVKIILVAAVYVGKCGFTVFLIAI
jgi:hypothetical protein